MTQPPLLVFGTGGIAVLISRGLPPMNDSRTLRLVAATLIACTYAAPWGPATAQQSPPVAGERPHLADGPGRQASTPNCPSLVDGRGGTVRSRGTGGAAEASFARDCPGLVAQPASVPQPVPIAQPRQAKRAEPSAAVRGLVAGSVQADLASALDPADGTPLVVQVTPERLSATILTGGTTLWLLHSGFWTYLLILGLPLWRHVDLLPIVDSASRESGPATDAAAAGVDEERAVARVLQARRPPRAGGGGRR
jgi:hypothetical protein